MIVHGGERNFECNVCNERFARKGCLKRHMQIHNKGKLPADQEIESYNYMDVTQLLKLEMDNIKEERGEDCVPLSND